MEYRNWNNKPLRTSLLGYGCMRFPTRADGSIDEPRAAALLNTAKAAGVNYFDTAYPYHNGQSEPFVGRVIAKWGSLPGGPAAYFLQKIVHLYYALQNKIVLFSRFQYK